jgi:peptide/nickel transport system permease protein
MTQQSLHAWLMSERPQSRRQAALGSRLWRLAHLSPATGWRCWGWLSCWRWCWWPFSPDVLAPYSPYTGDLRTTRLLAAFGAHWFGTDDQGRDILSPRDPRLAHHAVRGGSGGVLAAPIGLLVGTVAGYAGGWVDAVLMRITDIFLAFPPPDPGAGLRRGAGAGHRERGDRHRHHLLAALCPHCPRRNAEIRQADYIAAVQLIGASPWRIVLRHIMPLCVSSVIVRVTLDMAGIILTAAGLGFLGLGAQPPMPEWGALIANGRLYVLDQWWVAAAPGAAIFIVSLAFNLLGDGLRDALDPKSMK